MAQNLVSKNNIAELFDVSPRRIEQLTSEGVIKSICRLPDAAGQAGICDKRQGRRWYPICFPAVKGSHPGQSEKYMLAIYDWR